MNIFKLQIPVIGANKFIDQLKLLPEDFWVRFGQDLLIFTDKELKGDFGQQPTLVYSFPKDVSLTELQIVVQKARLFERQHPDVPVIYDRGRFLLVRLDSDLVKKLEEEDKTRYSFLPLRNGQIVFEEHDLAAFRRPPNSSIQALINKLSRAEFREVLRILTSFHTRYTTSREYLQASLQMQMRLRSMGYETRLDPFQQEGKQSQNIIAEKPRTRAGSSQVVIVTAHLDSVGVEYDEKTSAPGADDNGSGCAGLMEIARVFKDHKNEHDLRLILFGGEEEGCVGSENYVCNLSPSERARIKAVVNMDMIGFLKSPSQKVLIEGIVSSQPIINGLLEAAATYTGFSSIAVSHDPEDSDHVSFIRAQIPAVLTIEGVDGTNPNIHSADDTIDTINYDFALEILRMNVGYIAKEIG